MFWALPKTYKKWYEILLLFWYTLISSQISCIEVLGIFPTNALPSEVTPGDSIHILFESISGARNPRNDLDAAAPLREHLYSSEWNWNACRFAGSAGMPDLSLLIHYCGKFCTFCTLQRRQLDQSGRFLLGEQSNEKKLVFFGHCPNGQDPPPPPPINLDTQNFSVKENFGLSQIPPLLYEKMSKKNPVLGEISKKNAIFWIFCPIFC